MPVEIFWNLVQAAVGGDGLFDIDPPDCLSADEMARYHQLRFPKRRAEWLAGRWAAKSLLCEVVPALAGLPATSVTVANEAEGAPYVQVSGQILPGCLSLSHRGTQAAAAWVASENIRIGIDLELVEPRQPVFVSDYFTAAEADWVNAQPVAQRDRLVTLVWSAKEAGLKALRKGLRLDTRAIEILRVANSSNGIGWVELEEKMHIPPYSSFRIWYRDEGQYVLTLALIGSEEEVKLTQVGLS